MKSLPWTANACVCACSSILNVVLAEAGGFEVTHDSTSRSALKVTSSADGFGGSVARIEAPGKKGAGGFKLLEGSVVTHNRVCWFALSLYHDNVTNIFPS